MKPKLVFTVLAGLMVCLIFSTSQGANKFYYGGFHVESIYNKCSELKDSLRFNIVFGVDLNGYFNSLANASLQGVAEQEDLDSPTRWSSISHYTLWEAEGLQGSYVNLHYNGGTLVNDPSASGGKAWKFTRPIPPETIIQTGPGYHQELGDTLHPIEYTAEFRLKFRYSLYQPRGALGGEPPTAVCSLMVVETLRDPILKATTLYKNQFPNGGGYQPFLLNYTLPHDSVYGTNNSIEFQIYWFGIPEAEEFRIDYVKVYDYYGNQLMTDTTVANMIKTYVSQSWVTTPIQGTGEPVVYRWYLRDQPLSIDCYMPYAYIDNLLKANSPHIPGAQFSGNNRDSSSIHEYLLRTNPVEYMIDPYVFDHISTGSNFQACIDSLTKRLDYNKRKAESLNKDLWVAIQAFAMCKRSVTSCQGFADSIEYPANSGIFYCCGLSYGFREPTSLEVRVQTFLAMCYGANAVMNYRVPYAWNDSSLETGLYDQYVDTATQKWEEIKNFTGPRVEKLGPVFNQLTWQGACSSDSVGSFILPNDSLSYIKNIVPKNYYPPYVEVGFFRGPYESHTIDYFMLVNRRCLSSEGDSFKVFVEQDTTGKNFLVEDVYTNSTVAYISNECVYNNHDFTVYLRPGEGRLFRFWVPSYSPHPIIHVPS
jgi:hypothetical protein